MQLPTFDYERSVLGAGWLPIGIDEAGRGPLAGPVVACAVLYKSLEEGWGVNDEEKRWRLVRDSKQLSPKQREAAFSFVQEQFFVGVGMIGPETIDRVNILEATFLAMRSAVTALRQHVSHARREREWKLLIDGNQLIPNISLQQEAIVNGDSLVRSIAAASIIAKVTRDRIIAEADILYPGYGFAAHKGYGTALHMAALKRLGPSPIHRLSFRPVQLAIPENVNKRFSALLKPKRG